MRPSVVVLITILVAALLVAAPSRETRKLARGDARVQENSVADELRLLRSSRMLLEDAVTEAPAPVEEQTKPPYFLARVPTLPDGKNICALASYVLRH